jgi:hypothetical protein
MAQVPDPLYYYSLVHVRLSVDGPQDYIVIDKSDTVNFPHDDETGQIHLTSLRVCLTATREFSGDITLAVLGEVTAHGGEFKPFYSLPVRPDAPPLVGYRPPIIDHMAYTTPVVLQAAKAITNAGAEQDPAFKTTVALWALSDFSPPFTVTPGLGDLVMRNTVTAGEAVLAMTMRYYVQEA